MQVISSASEMREVARAARKEGKGLAFIPTMGALHEGHLSLFRAAAGPVGGLTSRDTRLIIVSIFVNPTQFNSPEDLAKYPRPLETDLELCKRVGVDVVFTPTEREIYPDGLKAASRVPSVAMPMEGEYRPGHFAGVCAVLYRLFHLVQPDVALFGEKDFQQIRVVEEMVREQEVPVEIIRCPTVRDPNGLAFSSRNARLSPGGYQRALVIPRTIQSVREAYHTKRYQVPFGLVEMAKMELADLKVDYVTVADPETLQPVETVQAGSRIFVAATVEGVRLIDNASLGPSKKK